MKKISIEGFIFNVFLTSRLGVAEFIPWEQGALLYKINCKRQQMKYELLDNKRLGKELSRLKSLGKVERLRWFSPSEGNIWIWNSGK